MHRKQAISCSSDDCDHILNLIITHDLSYNSDHKIVCVDLKLSKPHIEKKTFSYLRIKNINFTQFE